MKFLKGISAVVILMITASVFSCGQLGVVPIVGSGNLVSKSYAFTGFNNIILANDVQGTISYASTYSIDISVDDNIYPYLRVNQQGETLSINLGTLSNYSRVTLKVNIKTPDIQALSLQDESTVNVNGFNLAHDLTANLKDQCKLNGTISLANLNANVTDGCSMELTGTCTNINLTASDGCKIYLRSLTAVNSNVSAKDGCRIELNCSGTISGAISDETKLYYTGDRKSVV